MTVHLLQNAFNSGEISPQMLGRSDLPVYRHGVKMLENWLIRPQGGVVKRSGTRFVQECEDSAVKGRLVPFVFSTTQAYILEFCDLKIRIFRDEGPVRVAAETITGITQANPAVVTIAGHPYSDGDEVRIDSVVGMTEVNGFDFIVANKAANTFELSGIDSTAYTAYTSGGTAELIYEVTTTYTEAQLPDLRFAQSADKLYITHEDHAPAELTRTAHTTWTLADHEFVDGPYLELRVIAVGDDRLADTKLVDPGAGTGAGVAITATNPGFFSAARDVGRMLRYAHNNGPTATTQEGWGGILLTAVADAENATCSIMSGNDPEDEPPKLPPDGDHGQTKWYHLGAFYIGNYPRSVAFFEQRLAFAGTPLEPERFDASTTGGWDDFAPTSRVDNSVTDDSALSYQLGGSSDVQIIRWIARARNLVIGTTGGVWVVQASSNNESVTPTNINLPRASAYGCANFQPVVAYNTVLYASRSGKKVLTAGYSLDQDSYVATDLTTMSEHVTSTGITAMEFQQEPHSVVWCLRSDGQLAGVTYEPTQKLFGWHRQIIGGAFGSGDAVVESIAVIPSPSDDHDQLWMIVKRTIGGATVRHIEFMEQDFADSDDEEDAFFVDCGHTYDSTATSTITGLDHLEGETVQVLADGAVHPDRTVASGSITLNSTYSVVHVGYGFNADMETLPIEISGQTGSSAGRLIRPTHANVRLHRTLGLEYGTDADNLAILPFRNAGDPMDSPPPLFTGVKRITLPHGHEAESTVYLRQPNPLPAMVLFVAGSVGVSS